MDQVKRLSKEPISRLGELPVLSIAPTATVLEAVSLMQKHRTGCVLVCEGEKAVGIFTERDVLRRMGTSLPLDVPLRDVMSQELWKLKPTDLVGKALRIMKQRQCRHLPVVGPAGEPLGILSVKRLVRSLVEHFPSAVYNLPPSAHQTFKDRDGA